MAELGKSTYIPEALLDTPSESHLLQDPDPFVAQRRLFSRILVDSLVMAAHTYVGKGGRNEEKWKRQSSENVNNLQMVQGEHRYDAVQASEQVKQSNKSACSSRLLDARLTDAAPPPR